MKHKRLALIPGILILSVFLLMALCPSLFSAYGQKEMFRPWLQPSAEHLLGTNMLGYDIYTELVYGAGQTLLTGLCSSLLALLLGTVIGTLSTERGLVGGLFSGLINLFLLLPRLVTLIVLSTFLGRSQLNLILLIAAFAWSGIARNVRAKVMHLKGQPFMDSLTIQGFSGGHIFFRHLLPNLSDVLVARFLLGVNSCIMMESTLSFLGFGDLYHPTWGTMINYAYNRGAFIRRAYAYLLTPGLCIVLVSLAFYCISLYVSRKNERIAEV